jgi:hypothetical protein
MAPQGNTRSFLREDFKARGKSLLILGSSSKDLLNSLQRGKRGESLWGLGKGQEERLDQRHLDGTS